MVTSEDRWKLYPHLQILDELLLHLEAKRFNRLMTWMPPQHGKSELISRYFPVWYLCHNPNDRIILSSYEADFASSWGRRARDVFKEWAGPLFNLKLRDDSSSVKHWDIADHEGGMDTSGAGGSQTGKRANFFDIDDPHKNPQEARSKAFQERIYNWYLEAVDTRLPEDGIISITQTRWDVLDLSGRILETEPSLVLNHELLESLRNGETVDKDTWVILHLPAISNNQDILNRTEGMALCPELFTLQTLESKKNRMGTRSFAALYQGEPTPLEGNIFKREWFYDDHDNILSSILTNQNYLPSKLNEIRYWDFAASGESGDAAAGTKSTYHEDNLIFRGLVHNKFTAHQMLNTYKNTTRKDTKEVPSIIEQEPGSGTKLLIQRFREDPDLRGYTIRRDKVNVSKLERSFDLEVFAESGRVLFDTDTMSIEQIKKIINELLAFTGEEGGEDNIVDTLTGSARYWKQRPTVLKPRKRRRR